MSLFIYHSPPIRSLFSPLSNANRVFVVAEAWVLYTWGSLQSSRLFQRHSGCEAIQLCGQSKKVPTFAEQLQECLSPFDLRTLLPFCMPLSLYPLCLLLLASAVDCQIPADVFEWSCSEKLFQCPGEDCEKRCADPFFLTLSKKKYILSWYMCIYNIHVYFYAF